RGEPHEPSDEPPVLRSAGGWYDHPGVGPVDRGKWWWAHHHVQRVDGWCDVVHDGHAPGWYGWPEPAPVGEHSPPGVVVRCELPLLGHVECGRAGEVRDGVLRRCR